MDGHSICSIYENLEVRGNVGKVGVGMDDPWNHTVTVCRQGVNLWKVNGTVTVASIDT